MSDWNPIDALKAKYPQMGLSDQQIYQNLQDPAKFRSAFPEYQVSDDEIRTNIQKFGMTRPDLQAPPSAGKPNGGMQESMLGYVPGAGSANPTPQTNNYQPVAAEQTPQGHEAAVAARAAQQPVVDVAGHVAIGAGKSAAETATAIPRFIAPETTESLVPEKSLERHGTAETVGAGVEQVAEFMAGDALLKAGIGAAGKTAQAATLAQKYAALSKAHKLIEEYPVIAKIVGSALQQGVVGGTQALAHGADAKGALETGALAGGIGAASEGVIGAAQKILPEIQKLRPSTVMAGAQEAVEAVPGILEARPRYEGYPITARASQMNELGSVPSKAARTAEKYLVDPEAINRVAKQTSDDAKVAVGDMAGRVAGTTGKGLDEVAGVAKQEAEGVFTNTGAHETPIMNFGDAAKTIEGQTRYAVYSKLDELSAAAKQAGEIPRTFEETQEAISDAKRAIRLGNDAGEARVALKTAEAEQKAMMDKFGGYFHPQAIDRAKEAWRQRSALMKLQKVVDGATKGTPEDIEIYGDVRAQFSKETAAQAPEMINGKALLTGLRKLDRTGELRTALGGDENHRFALYQIANILASSPSKAEATRHIMLDTVGALGSSGAGMLLGHTLEGLAVGGSAAMLHESARLLFTKLLTDPKALSILGKGVESGAKVATVVRRLTPIIQGWTVNAQQPYKPSTAAPAPTPQSHVFHVGTWKGANPGGDVNAAIATAQQQGYEVVN